jgi:putative transcriptional regulator
VIKYKIDIVKELSEKGYNSAKLRKDKIMSQATLQNIRHGVNFNIQTLNDICIMLRCQPSDIIEIVPTDEEKIKFF